MCIYIYNYDVYNITLHDVYNYDKTNPSITNIYIYIGILRLTGLFCQQPASRHRLRLKTYSSEDLPSIHVPAPMWMTPAAMAGSGKNSSGRSDGS